MLYSRKHYAGHPKVACEQRRHTHHFFGPVNFSVTLLKTFKLTQHAYETHVN